MKEGFKYPTLVFSGGALFQRAGIIYIYIYFFFKKKNGWGKIFQIMDPNDGEDQVQVFK